MKHIWPRSLTGQMLLAVALALLLAQGIGAALVYRAQIERRDAALLHAAAFRLIAASQGDHEGPENHRGPRGMRLEITPQSPLRAGDNRDGHAEEELREILSDQGLVAGGVMVARRSIDEDSVARRRLERRSGRLAREHREPPSHVLVAAVQAPDRSNWLVARVFVPSGERTVLMTLIGQTLFIYGVLVTAIALILRRITRPLAALTRRLERFATSQSTDGQMEPEGPDDVRRLIVAHNAMEARIAGLLDEKDVMLGAIGHDLKTPLTALRVRIESVEDDVERGRMADTIEDIVRSLDDILSLARVGRPSDPREQSELSALVASVVEEFEDMGEPVELGDTQRIALPLRATWLRRALRNLISNAVRYGGVARVSIAREADAAVVQIDDDGPGIPDAELSRMLEPFTRGEPSRNSGTGGAGLGLTLARAIADQHGGSLSLVNRIGADGAVAGFTATLRLPLR